MAETVIGSRSNIRICLVSESYFEIILLSNLFALSVPDEDYSRNASCALHMTTINHSVYLQCTFYYAPLFIVSDFYQHNW